MKKRMFLVMLVSSVFMIGSERFDSRIHMQKECAVITLLCGQPAFLNYEHMYAMIDNDLRVLPEHKELVKKMTYKQEAHLCFQGSFEKLMTDYVRFKEVNGEIGPNNIFYNCKRRKKTKKKDVALQVDSRQLLQLSLELLEVAAEGESSPPDLRTATALPTPLTSDNLASLQRSFGSERGGYKESFAFSPPQPFKPVPTKQELSLWGLASENSSTN